MTAHRALNWLLAAIICVVYGFIAAQDAPELAEDRGGEWAESAALQDAQRDARRAFEADMAAARYCRQQYGEAGYTRTEAGQVVCLPRQPLYLSRAK